MNEVEPSNGTCKCDTPRHGKPCKPHLAWTIGLLGVAALIGITLAFNAKALGSSVCGQWHGAAHWHGPDGGASLSKHLQSMVVRLFDRAGASSDQSVQARATVEAAASATTLTAMISAHEAIRRGFIASLSAPTIDRIELEALRLKALAQLDSDSRVILKVAGDLAEILSPAQRKRLAGMADSSAHP